MTKKALLIGINYFNSDLELNGCINDVDNMETLLSAKGYRCIKLTDNKNNIKSSLYPNRKNILKWINWFVNNTNEKTQMFLHFSGHGCYTRDRNNDERDGKDETIIPVDLISIVDDEIIQILSKTNGTIHSLFDCCHSGTILDLRYRYEINRDIPFTDKKYKETKGKIISISGCKDKQTSADAWFRNIKEYRGALTYFVLFELQKEDITYKQLIKNIRFHLSKSKLTQIPQLSSSKKININKKIEF